MSKEEYAELCYLLGKLKYSLIETAINSNSAMKQVEIISDKINDILKIVFIDGEGDKEKTRVFT